jgi:hypothetical protein
MFVCIVCNMYVPRVPLRPASSSHLYSCQVNVANYWKSCSYFRKLLAETSADSCKGLTNISVVKGDTTVRVGPAP